MHLLIVSLYLFCKFQVMLHLCVVACDGVQRLPRHCIVCLSRRRRSSFGCDTCSTGNHTGTTLGSTGCHTGTASSSIRV